MLIVLADHVTGESEGWLSVANHLVDGFDGSWW